jgi:hypothetical protein
MKKILSLLLACVMTFGFSTQIFAADTSARSIVIFQTEGSDVTMTKGTAKVFAAKAGIKLLEGYTVSTGVSSYAYLQLDGATIVKIDQQSQVSVSRASSTKLSLSVISGALSVNAAPQKQGDTLEVRAGNSALAVRGTIFTVEDQTNGDVGMVMFTGGGDVDGRTLSAGNTMNVSANKTSGYYDQETIDITKLSPFALGTLLEYADEIIARGGFLTADQIEQARTLYNAAMAPSTGSSSPSSSGSDTSSSAADTQSSTVTVNPADQKVVLQYNEGDGSVAVKLPAGDTTNALDQMVADARNNDDVAVIDASSVGDASSVQLPANVVDRLASEGLGTQVKLSNGSVNLDSAAVQAIQDQAGGSDVSVAIDSNNNVTVKKSGGLWDGISPDFSQAYQIDLNGGDATVSQ